MPTAIWGELESQDDEAYPLVLLKHLLQQMMTQFAARGGCIALFDEGLSQMVIRLHVRMCDANPVAQSNTASEGVPAPAVRRATINLQDPSASAVGRLKSSLETPEELEDIAPQESDLFPVGTAYPLGQDLIGYTWREGRSCIMQHESYIASFRRGRQICQQADLPLPTWYFALPIQDPDQTLGTQGKKRQPRALGVVVLYQTTQMPGFHLKQRQEAPIFSERMALYLQNHTLRRARRRTSASMQRLQQITASFPATVNLADLMEQAYQFVTEVLTVSSMLVTLFDRDSVKIYDVFAIRDSQRVEGLPAQALAPQERPVWWRITQQEKRSLLFNPTQLESGDYDELLQGIWGDQRKTESFLLLPLKMFTRVLGSLCLTCTYPHAFSHEEVQVLETMVQIMTVSMENARLYERSRLMLRKARQREESLAAMNSALQAVSAVLNLGEMLDNFVKVVANLVQAEMCVFFQLSADKAELVAQALYAPKSKGKVDEILLFQSDDKEKHAELIEMIHLPFKGSLLERLVNEGSFFYLDAPMVDELAQVSSEGGVIFLRETHIQKMIMIPVQYQTELVGILAIHTPRQNRVFRPEEIGMLLAICSQTASAMRNGQLFEQINEANAELQHMNKLKDEFIVTASHELRTPLSAISGYASLLKRQSARATPEQVLRFATRIMASTQQLSALVANMTDAANMDALGKKLDVNISSVQVWAAAQVAVSMVSINIEQKVTMEIPADLWVQCDPVLLRQVIINLLDNAAKYSPPDGAIKFIARPTTLAEVPLPEELIDHASLIEQGGDLPVVLVSVHDEGEGVQPEEQQRIFEKFVRATRSLTTPVRGSGLGLYICRRYMEAMGGKLWLEQSIPGEGSVFSFYLPRSSPPPETGDEQYEPEPGIS
ncbi:MAG: ATP-binding protein [Ktedonobacteraceae bacterium]